MIRRPPRFAPVDREAFYVERRTAGMTRKEAAQYLGVTVRTIRNWENGSTHIPYSAFKCVRLRAGGIVHASGVGRLAFCRGGALYSPCGRSFLSWELYHIRHMFNMLDHLRQAHSAERVRVHEVSPPRLVLVGGSP